MTNTYRVKTLTTHDHWAGNRSTRRFFAKYDRRTARRQQARISREALVNYYDDLSWIEKLEADIEAQLEAEESYEWWFDKGDDGLYEVEWNDGLDLEFEDDGWTGYYEYEWLDSQMAGRHA